MLTGVGFAAGVASYNHLRVASGDRPSRDMWSAIIGTGKEIVSYYVEQFKETHRFADTFNPTAVLTDTEAALSYYMDNDPFDASWKILDVELTLPEHGYARIDLGVEAPDGALAVVDYKVKMNLQARYYDAEVNKYAYDHQQYHYAWGYGVMKERKVERYYIALMVLRPQKSVKLHPYSIDPEYAQDWQHFSQNAWDRMDVLKEHPEQLTQNPEHQNQYGPCPFKNACLIYKLDPLLMAAKEYVQAKRVKHTVPGEEVKE